jgi:anti-sigma B factor antagonist
MQSSPDERLSPDVTGDHVADLVDRRLVETDLEGQVGTGVEPAPTRFDVRRVDHPLGVVLILGGELDLTTGPVLQEQLDHAVRSSAAVVIDLAGVAFIDSSGLRVLVRAEQELRAAGGQLVLLGGSRAVYRVFELTGLDRYFEWCDSPSPQTAAELDRAFRGVMRS